MSDTNANDAQSSATLDMTQAELDKGLVRATEKGDYNEVKRLLKNGANMEARHLPPLGRFNSGAVEVMEVDELSGTAMIRVLSGGRSNQGSVTKDEVGRTALQAAAAEGYTGIVTLLIESGSDVCARPGSKFGRTALQAAAGGGHIEVVEVLLKHKADVNARAADYDGRTALQAAADGHEMIVQLLLEHGADVNAPASLYGRTALQVAAGGGHEPLVQSLLDREADINTPAADNNGRTALQAAAEGGHQTLVQLLLDNKADINAPAAIYDGRTALQAAAGGGHENVVQLLLDHKADINACAAHSQGRTALQAAAEGGHERIVQLLLDHQADVNAPAAERTGRTALQAAVGGGHEKIVQLLLDHQADVNAPAAESTGRTALQAAAERGNRSLVQLLLAYNADVNAPVAELDGRTAVQAAAGGGYERVLQTLLDHKANINAPPDNESRAALQAAAGGGHEKVVKLLLDLEGGIKATSCTFQMTALQAAAEGGHENVVNLLLNLTANAKIPIAGAIGRAALSAAAERGHEKVVKLLLDLKVNPNIPDSNLGRTILQVAAGGGYEKVVRLLLDYGADVNAQPSSYGSTALQAAVEGGHLKVVQLLLDSGADVNAPPSDSGMTALQAAVNAGHEEVLEILLGSVSDLALTRSLNGQNILHYACMQNNPNMVEALLRKSTPTDRNLRDCSGSTPLHVAVRNKQLLSVKLLIDKGINIDSRDTSRNTALQIALNAGLTETVKFLLRSGATTDGIPISGVSELLKTYGGACDDDLLILWNDPTVGRYPQGVTTNSTINYWSDEYRESKSICFWNPSSRSKCSEVGSSFAFPGNFLGQNYYPHPGSTGSVIHWAWGTRNRWEKPKLHTGIPDNQEIMLGSVILVGYIRFHWPCQILETDTNPSKDLYSIEFPPFASPAQEVEISWILRQAKQVKNAPDRTLRSMHYIGTLDLKTLAIPRHGTEFATWLLVDINKRWMKVIDNAKAHLTAMRDLQLELGGQAPRVIEYLLRGSREWSRLRKGWEGHLATAKELLSRFQEHDALFMELLPPSNEPETNKGPKVEDINKLQAIKDLSKEVLFLQKDCGDALSMLDKETKELIELEFNLVSIHEARRSIEMSASMKRLSWITFIFLPLMFVTGLLGMNVNILQSYPQWQWYAIIAAPLLALVLIVWILCKYLPVANTIEEHIGDHLQFVFDKIRDIYRSWRNKRGGSIYRQYDEETAAHYHKDHVD